jgi:phage shock protein E
MIAFIKKILGIGPSVDYKALMQKGAMIIDVRTKGEYASGHIKGSLNIPVNEMSNQLSKISKDKIIITCCASGMRSGSAKSILKSKGYPDVYNGGPWNSLQRKIS